VLAIIYALKKFFQHSYGREFILVTDHQPLVAMFGPNKPSLALAANRLSRWALFLRQFNHIIEYRKTSEHSNADVLSRLPEGEDPVFDRDEITDDVDTVCTIKTLSLQVEPTDSSTLRKESSRDPTLTKVMRFMREGWSEKKYGDDPADKFRKITDSLSVCHGCLLYGARVVIPAKLRRQVLDLVHECHFGIQRMKQLARTAVYWPNIDSDILDLCRQCSTYARHQSEPSKAAVHPWMLPEKPWSRLHIDHVINFLGFNWLVVTDACTKYPCIYATQSVSAKSTIKLLQEDFAHFGFPHAVVTDCATTFKSDEFQEFCKESGIVHLTGAPYHPATNGAAERLVQTFKQALKKLDKAPKDALQDFLRNYRRTPLSTSCSPSELLNGRQIRTKTDTLLPSPAHTAQGKQAKEATKSQQSERHLPVTQVSVTYKVGDPC